MGKEDYGNSFDRRVFLGASTATLLGLPGISLAQQQRPSEPHVGSEPATRAPSQAIADFATGFDLKSAPPIVIERARIAFVDTVGVMLAGSQSSPTDIVCDIIKLEGTAPVATIVGQHDDCRANRVQKSAGFLALRWPARREPRSSPSIDPLPGLVLIAVAGVRFVQTTRQHDADEPHKAGAPNGATEALMLAHGFTNAMLDALVRNGLGTAERRTTTPRLGYFVTSRRAPVGRVVGVDDHDLSGGYDKIVPA
jgi:MmgE/PrpD N-terminal domain